MLVASVGFSSLLVNNLGVDRLCARRVSALEPATGTLRARRSHKPVLQPDVCLASRQQFPTMMVGFAPRTIRFDGFDTSRKPYDRESISDSAA
jgi:hypothetical protein